MAIYSKDGTELLLAYNKNGDAVDVAYDKSGNIIYTKEDITLLKVMTYNCGQWLTGSTGSGTQTENENAVIHRALANTILQAQNADILCIQEYYGSIGDVLAQEMLEQYFPYVHEVNPYYTWYGHCVCSKYPINNFATTNLGNYRYLDRFSITIGEKDIEIFNAHLGFQDEQKIPQAEQVFSVVQNYDSFVLCGDFNTTCDSTEDVDYINVIKQFIDAGYNSANCSDQHGFIGTYTEGQTASGTWLCCDQIMTSSDIDIRKVWIDTTKITDSINEKIDHVPLLAEMIIRNL